MALQPPGAGEPIVWRLPLGARPNWRLPCPILLGQRGWFDRFPTRINGSSRSVEVPSPPTILNTQPPLDGNATVRQSTTADTIGDHMRSVMVSQDHRSAQRGVERRLSTARRVWAASLCREMPRTLAAGVIRRQLVTRRHSVWAGRLGSSPRRNQVSLHLVELVEQRCVER